MSDLNEIKRDLKEIKMQDVVDAVMQAAYGAVKVMQSALEAAQLIAKITADVVETLREAGIMIDRTPEPLPATNTRVISAESKIAHMAVKIIIQCMQAEPEQPELVSFADEFEQEEINTKRARRRGKTETEE